MRIRCTNHIASQLLVLLLITPSVVLAQAAVAENRGSGLSQILFSFFLGIASGLAVAWIRGWRPGRQTHEQQRTPPVLDFHRRLGAQIERQPSAGTTDVDVHARAIVGLSQRYRKSIDDLRGHLNSDLDKLASQIRDLEGLARAPAQQERVRGQIEQTLAVLRQTWPDKEAAIEVELLKLRVQQGDTKI